MAVTTETAKRHDVRHFIYGLTELRFHRLYERIALLGNHAAQFKAGILLAETALNSTSPNSARASYGIETEIVLPNPNGDSTVLYTSPDMVTLYTGQSKGFALLNLANCLDQKKIPEIAIIGQKPSEDLDYKIVLDRLLAQLADKIMGNNETVVNDPSQYLEFLKENGNRPLAQFAEVFSLLCSPASVGNPLYLSAEGVITPPKANRLSGSDNVPGFYSLFTGESLLVFMQSPKPDGDLGTYRVKVNHRWQLSAAWLDRTFYMPEDPSEKGFIFDQDNKWKPLTYRRATRLVETMRGQLDSDSRLFSDFWRADHQKRIDELSNRAGQSIADPNYYSHSRLMGRIRGHEEPEDNSSNQ